MKGKKNFKKDGKEIMELYKKMKKDGVTPEDGILFLLAYMQDTKSASIGMDISGEDGKTFCLTINLNEGTVDDNTPATEEKMPPSTGPPAVA